MARSSKAVAAKPVPLECCHRCGGLMISERVHELGSYDWRCLSCGERIDPVILKHREEDVVRAEGEKVLIGQGKSRLI